MAIICEFKDEDSSIFFSFVFRENFLNKFSVSGEFCQSNEKIDCTEKSEFRTPTGLCNNLVNPKEGNSHTAFGRLKPAAYSDCM
jgi:hypothetical protein